jgi:uncharacterized protein YgfB (UPF0149 family)
MTRTYLDTAPDERHGILSGMLVGGIVLDGSALAVWL